MQPFGCDPVGDSNPCERTARQRNGRRAENTVDDLADPDVVDVADDVAGGMCKWFVSPLGHKISPEFLQVRSSGLCRIQGTQRPVIPL